MKHFSPAVVFAVLTFAMATPLHANDTTAETAAGGLVLTRNTDIDMREEDLFVSTKQIRVRYVFRNMAAQDRTVTVAFPMPTRDLSTEERVNFAYPADFVTTVSGRPVQTQIERKAMLGTVDHSALLRKLGVPLTQSIAEEGVRIGQVLNALPRADQDHLVRLRLVKLIQEEDEAQGLKRVLSPAWTIHETWYWLQTFPAGRDLTVEHRYTPGAGSSLVSPLLYAGRDSKEGRQMVRDYCLDTDFLNDVDRLWKAANAPSSTTILAEERINYVLTTGANWRSPIGRFRLVVDKGTPGSLVSFCGSGIRKLSPTQFEMVRTQWRPDRDLRVLIFKN